MYLSFQSNELQKTKAAGDLDLRQHTIRSLEWLLNAQYNSGTIWRQAHKDYSVKKDHYYYLCLVSLNLRVWIQQPDQMRTQVNATVVFSDLGFWVISPLRSCPKWNFLGRDTEQSWVSHTFFEIIWGPRSSSHGWTDHQQTKGHPMAQTLSKAITSLSHTM